MKVLCVSVILALCAAAPVSAQAIAASYRLNIPRQPLDTALKDFAHQTGLQIARFSDTMDGSVMAGPVSGEFSAAQALATLLAPNGLTYRMVNDRTIAVVKPGDAPNSELTEPLSAAGSQVGEAARWVDGGTSDSSSKRSLRLAQNDQSIRSAESEGDQAPARNSSSNDDRDKTSTPLSEIVVTGTHIRGEAAVGSSIIVLDRVEIDKTGFATTQQVIQSLPQNFQGGANEDTLGSGEGRGFANFGVGAGINLRGLGPDSTLTLVNGRRVARGGFGTFVDVSTIPMTAIERIEVLPDGASALYGSDAIGGVVNVILRTDFDGVETRARYGTVTEGSAAEYQAGFALGRRWQTGHALISYEYYRRDNLAAQDRDFLTEDLRPFGGDDFREPGGNPGNITNFVDTFAIPAGQDGTALTPADLLPGVVNMHDSLEGADMLPKQERHSVFLSASREVTERLELFVEGRYSERQFERRATADNVTFFVPASNPFFVDPFGGSDGVFVQYSFIDDLGNSVNLGEVRAGTATAGATLDLPGTWTGEVYGIYSRERIPERFVNSVNRSALDVAVADPNPATAFNPFGDGSNNNPATIEAIKGFNASNQLFELWSVNGQADGMLFALPGGDVKLAFGAEYREESLEQDFTAFLFVPEPEVRPTTLQDRSVIAGFAEILVPIIGERNRLPGIRSLEVSVAGRVEDYSDFGTTENPKVGLSWSPLPGLIIRGSYGTSFKAPILSDLGEGFNSSVFFDFIVDDPMSPTGSTTVLALSGSNPDLVPEEGTTWTAGLDFRPEAIPGLSLAVTYFDIKIDNRVLDGFSELFTILEEEERLAARIVTRTPDLATVQALFADPRFVNVFGSTPEDIGAIIDLRLKNIGSLSTNGLDLAAAYSLDTAIGRFDLRAAGSYFFTFTQAQTPTSPAFDVLNTLRNPVDWRMRNSLGWAYAGFSATAFINYTDSYTDDESDPERRIGSWTTVDLSVAYDMKDRPKNEWLQDTVLSLSAQNLFNNDPPFVNNQRGFGYDPENADSLGRFISFQITKRW